jgi:hypothetical protein
MSRDARNAREIRAAGGKQNVRSARGTVMDAAALDETWPRQVSAAPLRKETAATVFGNLLLILVQAVVVLGGIGFWLGSMLLVDVLNEIRQRDFTASASRIASYDEFFDGLRKAGCKVVKDEPRIIREGESTYLWTVEPKGRDDLCRFQWRHSFDENEVVPQTNAALLLDLRQGFIKPQEIAANKELSSIYDPNDQIALGLINANPNAKPPAAALPPATQLPDEGVGAPLITPEAAKGRASHGKPKEAPPEEVVPGDGTGGDQGGAGGAGGGDTPPRVEPPDSPPVDGGGGTEPPPDDGGGGGETPPDGGGGGGEKPPEGGTGGY